MMGHSALSLPKVLHLMIGPHLLLLSTVAFRGDKIPTETPNLSLPQPEHNSGVVLQEWEGAALV